MASYLFGDSTSSGLELNYIELTKAAVDLAVELLLADHRAQDLEARIAERRLHADAELGELHEIVGLVGRALDSAPGQADGLAQRCATTIREAGHEAARNAAAQVRGTLADEVAALQQQIARERQVAARALETFLIHHDLPGADLSIELDYDAATQRYRAVQRGRSDIGLGWALTLAIPDGSLFAQALKLERVAPHLEVRVPESGGWMRKGTRIKAQKLGAFYLVELHHSADQTTYKLRSSPHLDEAGFNVQVSADFAPLKLVRVAKGGEHSPPFELLDEDLPRLLELTGQLRTDVAALAHHRESLVDAELDGTLLTEHTGPGVAARRLIGKLAPVVQEIAHHSMSRTELVLKRVLQGDRREELFVAKAELEAKLEPLPPTLRSEFTPLGLGGPPSERAGHIEIEPRDGHDYRASTDADPTHVKEPIAPARTKPRTTPPAPPPRPLRPPPGYPAAPSITAEDDVTSVTAGPPKPSAPLEASVDDTEASTKQPTADSIDVALNKLEQD